MRTDESFDGWTCQEDWNSFSIVSVPDRDDLSRTVTEVQALIHEGQALVPGSEPTDGVDDHESSHGTGKDRALSSSALMINRETQTIHESPRDSGVTASIPVLESPQATAVEMDQTRNAVAEEIIASPETSSTQKAAENILHTSSSQVKEPAPPPKNVQDRDVMVAPSASKVPSYIEVNQTLSLDDTGSSVQPQYCIGTTRQGRDCKDTAERGRNFCHSHFWQAKATTGTKIDSLPVATLVQCVAVSKSGTRCANAARKGAAHCGKHLLPASCEDLMDTLHQCRRVSTRGNNRCKNAAKTGQLFCGRHLPSSTTVVKPATPSKAMPYDRNAMPPTAIPGTKTIVMCVGPSCRDTAKKGSLYCRQHSSSLPAIHVLLANVGVAHCVAITKTGKQCVDPAISGPSYCCNHNHNPRSSGGVCAAVTKTGKLCIDPTAGGTLFCYNHRRLATSLVVKTQTAPPSRTAGGLVQTAAVNNAGGQQLLAALINCLSQQACGAGIPTGDRATTAGVGCSSRCQGLTEAGKRCKDTAKKNSPFCGRHCSTGSNPVGAEDLMSQLKGYIDGRLDSTR
jgi:hypothetical protein